MGVCVNRTGIPPKSRLRHALVISVLVLYTLFILTVTLSPTQLDVSTQRLVFRFVDVLHRFGVPTWFDYAEVEFSANILMFIPFGFMVTLLLPIRFAWLAVFIALSFSTGIELFQREFLDARIFDVRDIVANTIGGTIGWVMAAFLRSLVHARDKHVIARALWQARRGLPPTG
jgi:glycopeptide antibiotics resistance protein